MHYYINRRVKDVLDGCSMLSGLLFQLNWNTVPTHLEQESNLAVPKREFIKLTPSAYRVGNERWCLGVGRMSRWAVISCGKNCLDGAKPVSNVTRIRDKRNSLC